MPNDEMLVIDCLQVPKPSRARFQEWRDGSIDCVHVTLAIWEGARDTLSAIGRWNREFDENSDLVAHATSSDDITAIKASGRTAVIFGFQNTSPFEDDIDLIRVFHTLGVRIAQLTYNVQNAVASGCWEDDSLGLSSFFGRNVVKEMNAVGMLIDISHCNEQTGFDAVEHSERPIAITHGNPSEFVGFDIELNRRNKTTEQIRAVVDNGGILGLSMYPKIMKDGSDCSLETFCEMIEWSAERFGIDHIALGSDWYAGHPVESIEWWRAGRWARKSPLASKSAFSDWPKWYQSCADTPVIFQALSDRGFSDEDVMKFAGQNWLRFFNESFKPQGK